MRRSRGPLQLLPRTDAPARRQAGITVTYYGNSITVTGFTQTNVSTWEYMALSYATSNGQLLAYNVTNLGGTMRLGSQPAKLLNNSLAHLAYGQESIQERHRHRYEFNNLYRQQYEAHGFRFSGTSPDGQLVEIIELPSHPWFLAVQFHPEFKSKPTKAHPLFAAFVDAAIARHDRRKNRTVPNPEPSPVETLS